jgi:hypothetical protein
VITGWYALWPNDELRVFAQSVVFVFAWSLLILATSKLFKNRLLSGGAAIVIWLLGFSPLVAQWNVLILSESLTISFLTASLAALLTWLRNQQVLYFQLFAVLLIGAALIRPQLFIVELLVAISWLFFGRRFQGMTQEYVMTSVVLVAGALLSIGQQLWNDHNSSDDQLVGRTTWIYTNALLPSSPFAERLVQALPPQTPECIVPKQPLGDTAGQFLIEQYRATCPEGLVWIQENFQEVYLRFLITDPVSTTSDIARLLWQSAAMYVYGTINSLGPNSQLSSLFALDDSRFFLLALVVIITTTLVSWRYLNTNLRKNISTLILLTFFFGLSWVAALLLQIADLHRTSVTSIVPINILLLIIFFSCIDELSNKKTLRQQFQTTS